MCIMNKTIYSYGDEMTTSAIAVCVFIPILFSDSNIDPDCSNDKVCSHEIRTNIDPSWCPVWALNDHGGIFTVKAITAPQHAQPINDTSNLVQTHGSFKQVDKKDTTLTPYPTREPTYRVMLDHDSPERTNTQSTVIMTDEPLEISQPAVH